MRKINSKFQTKFISEDGGELINRDYFAFVELDKFSFYVLADGLDDDKEELSAQIAVTSVIRSLTEEPTLNKRKIKGYISKAHKELKEFDSGMQLRASIIVVVTNYVKYRYVVCGNSRFYLIRNGVVHTKSVDQSLTMNLAGEEKVEQDKIARHEERNNLYSYLGQEEGLKIWASKAMKLMDADTFLLMSRGIWESCDEGEIIDACAEAKEPQEILDGVEELILSKQAEDLDNYTLAVTFVDKIYRKPNKKWTAKKIILMVLPFVIIGAIIGIVLLVRYNKKKDNIQAMTEYIASGKEYAENDNYERAKEEYKEALKLAKKLKREKEKEELNDYGQLFEQILLADETLDKKEYKEAVDAYLKAEELTKETGKVGRGHINSQLEKTRDYIDILDLLAEGDRKIDNSDPKGAREAYKAAKELANQIFYQEGKQEAIDKMDKIDAEAAARAAEAKAEKDAKEAKKEEKAKEKEEKEKEKEEKEKQEEEEKKVEKEEKEKEKEEKKAEEEEKLADQLNALEIEKKANAAYSTGNFEDAKMYYLTAQEMYLKLGLDEKANLIETKIQITEKKSSDLEKKNAKAEGYVADADTYVTKKKYDEARILYLLARDIYDKAELTVESSKVNDKIVAIDKIQSLEDKK